MGQGEAQKVLHAMHLPQRAVAQYNDVTFGIWYAGRELCYYADLKFSPASSQGHSFKLHCTNPSTYTPDCCL